MALDKIDIRRIVTGHVASMRNFATDKLSVSDLALFFGMPLVAAAVAVYLGWGFYVDALNALLAAFAIFAGLLLNLLLLIYTFSTNASYPTTLAKTRSRFVKELHDNIAFAVLVSVLIVMAAFVGVAELKMKDPQNPGHTGSLLSFVLVFLTANFVLTLLMILKRIHVLLSNEIDKPSMRKVS